MFRKGNLFSRVSCIFVLFLAAVKITCSELESIHWRFPDPFLSPREEGGVEYWVTFSPPSF